MLVEQSHQKRRNFHGWAHVSRYIQTKQFSAALQPSCTPTTLLQTTESAENLGKEDIFSTFAYFDTAVQPSLLETSSKQLGKGPQKLFAVATPVNRSQTLAEPGQKTGPEQITLGTCKTVVLSVYDWNNCQGWEWFAHLEGFKQRSINWFAVLDKEKGRWLAWRKALGWSKGINPARSVPFPCLSRPAYAMAAPPCQL